MVLNELLFQKIEPFDMKIEYKTNNRDNVIEGFEHHIHNECEIYINVSGNVNFMVENSIYPIQSGSVIITKPYEYHHCIYNTDEPHKHFWILFSCDGNEELFEKFLKRKSGTANLFNFSLDKKEKLFEICHSLCASNTKLKQYVNFFELLLLLESGDSYDETIYASDSNIGAALQYIKAHFTENITVKDIADSVHVSVNTLERWFEKAVQISPKSYVKDIRFGYALKLLSKGDSVTESALKSGFSDCSAFISLFKKRYGMTPLKYKQQIEKRG